jgi:hypothetical protein
MQKPKNFDPMQSPNQMQGNTQKFNDNFFFWIIIHKIKIINLIQ